jgi:pyruvate dehydrogenase E1 component alpha subunit
LFTNKLKEEGLIKDADIKAMEKEIDDEIENDCIKFIEESPEPKVEDLHKFVLDDNPDPRWIGPLQNKEA